MDWLTKSRALAAVSRGFGWFVLAIALGALGVVGVSIWKLQTAAPIAVLTTNPTPAKKAALPSASAAQVAPVTAVSTPLVLPASAGKNDTAACNDIANTAAKDLNALNARVADLLTKAKSLASAGDFQGAQSTAQQANQLGAQGASEQNKYLNELNAQNCSAALKAQFIAH